MAAHPGWQRAARRHLRQPAPGPPDRRAPGGRDRARSFQDDFERQRPLSWGRRRLIGLRDLCRGGLGRLRFRHADLVRRGVGRSGLCNHSGIRRGCADLGVVRCAIGKQASADRGVELVDRAARPGRPARRRGTDPRSQTAPAWRGRRFPPRPPRSEVPEIEAFRRGPAVAPPRRAGRSGRDRNRYPSADREAVAASRRRRR